MTVGISEECQADLFNLLQRLAAKEAEASRRGAKEAIL